METIPDIYNFMHFFIKTDIIIRKFLAHGCPYEPYMTVDMAAKTLKRKKSPQLDLK